MLGSRAKKELIITWNSGQTNQTPALAFKALWNYWDKENAQPTP